MRSKTIAAAVLAAIACAFVAAPAGADVVKKKVYRDANGRVITVVRSSTHVVVQRRSFLDPGTETLPLDEHYHDYAFNPTYTPFPNQGGVVGFWRAPLPSPVDLPSFYNFGGR
jgi:hypothetical protein